MDRMSFNVMDTYKPTAIYYEDGDFLEYVRKDIPTIDRRVDEYLTLIVDMYNRRPVGVKLKGFKHLYYKGLSQGYFNKGSDFILLTEIVEKVMTLIGDSLFEKIELRQAYQQAIDITKSDNVRVDKEQFAA